MSSYKTFEEGIEVNGTTILSIVDGLGAFTMLAEKHFLQVGLPHPRDIDESQFYSQQKWLNAFYMISKSIGTQILYQIGKKIPENAIFPPEINNIVSALQSIDVAYHMNHRNRSKDILFDVTKPPEQRMLEGIGHYKYQYDSSGNAAVIVCENPYPCDFDRGIITAMSHRFNLGASIEHDDSKPCRKNGADSCTYIVKWRN